MALIVCPRCGKRISDKAPACIQCGYRLKKIPIRSRVANNSKASNFQKNQRALEHKTKLETNKKAHNLIAEIPLTNESKNKIVTLFEQGGSISVLTTAEFINEYFEAAKRGNSLNPQLGNILVNMLQWMMKDTAHAQECLEQAALYRNVYRESFSKLCSSMIEYFNSHELEVAISWLDEFAKTQDSEYEAMLRRRGTPAPF